MPSRALLAAALAVAVSSGALGQVQPDAGRIQQELERRQGPGVAPQAPPAPVLLEPVRPALTAPETARFLVRGFRVTRATAFSETELVALLGDFVGKEQSLADLQRAADLVTRFYRDRGYFVARAYIPAQDIRDGIVEIMILEGRLDRVLVRPAGATRLRPGLVEATLRAALPADGLIRQADLERGLLLLNDLPGVDVRAVLAPGAELGTSVVTAELGEGPLIAGTADFDNYGNKFVGAGRLGGSLSLNDPSGYGDLLSLRVLASSGASYARIAYQLPFGHAGFRLGGAYAETHYELCCEFAALRASGTARTGMLSGSYPLLRSRDVSVHVTAAYDARHFVNAAATGTTSDKTVDVVTLGLSGESRDFLGGGGLNSFAAAVSLGRLDLDGLAADRALDDASARTHGRYAKLAFSMARLQRVAETTSVYAALAGQVASRNLDSSEKFVLGGPYGVRGYPTGEAAGDAALLVNLELRHEVKPGLQVAAFVDHGGIRLHRRAWDGWQGANPHIRNRYGLSALGLALNWSQPGDFLVRASVAQRIGDNPGRDASENDSDNTKDRARAWLQVMKYF